MKSKAFIIDQHIKEENWNWFDYERIEYKTLQIEGKWQSKFNQLVDDSIEGIIIDAKSTVADLSFVSNFPNLKSIGIASEGIANFDAIKQLGKLESLFINSNKNQQLNLDIEANLKVLSVGWKSKFEITYLPQTIEYLGIDNASNIDWTSLLKNKNSLIKIDLVDCGIDRADILFKLKSLRYLSLTGCRKLNFDNVGTNSSLRFIDFREIPLKSLQWINSLTGIQIVCISTAGKLDTISNIRDKKSIIGLFIAGNTTIEDGDLSALETLDNLRNCFIVGKRPYSHKTIESWNWENFNLPKRELLKKKRLD